MTKPKHGGTMNRRFFLIVGASAGFFSKGNPAFAKKTHHNNGHRLLGEKLKRNGKHSVGKAGKHEVVAEVANSKVVSMTAGNLAVRKVKSRRQMSSGVGGFSLVADRTFDVAQVEIWWYAYCFDDGFDEYCYWYPAAYVVVTDDWVEYYPV